LPGGIFFLIEKQDKKRVGGLVNFHQEKKLEASTLLLSLQR
jgi:hypothetical protein